MTLRFLMPCPNHSHFSTQRHFPLRLYLVSGHCRDAGQLDQKGSQNIVDDGHRNNAMHQKHTGNIPSPPLGPQTDASGFSHRICFSTFSYSIRRTYTSGSFLKKNLRVLGICRAVERWTNPDFWSRSDTGNFSGRGSGTDAVEGTSL